MHLLPLLLLLPLTTALYLFPTPGIIPTLVPASCRAALSTNITCTPSLVRAATIAGGRPLNEETAALYCTDACHQSLKTFATNVRTRCGETAYAFYPDTPEFRQSGAELAGGFVWAWEVGCVSDAEGFCLQALFEGKKDVCSDCFLKYQALLLSSDYGRGLVGSDEEFTSTLKSCGVPTTKYTYTYSTRPTSTATTTTAVEPTATPRCEGGVYTVKTGDSCVSIARTAGMALDRLVVGNGLDYGCESLKVGGQLCLEKACKLHTVVEGETCADMFEGTDWGMNMLVSWNPTIHRNCDNFDAFVGRSICVSPPGSLEFVADPVDEGTTTIVPIITATWEEGPVDLTPIPFNTTWYSLTTTHTIPTQTAIINETRENLIHEKTQFCWITTEMWERGFDPYDLTAGCQTLYNRYCEPNPDAPAPTSARIPAVCTPTVEAEVEPAAVVASLQAFRAAGAQGNRVAGGEAATTKSGASVTRVSASGPVPTPVQEGMVSECKKFFRVRHDGESCRSIARHWNVPESKFLSWNPAVGKDCDGLKIGYYVCISA